MAKKITYDIYRQLTPELLRKHLTKKENNPRIPIDERIGLMLRKVHKETKQHDPQWLSCMQLESDLRQTRIPVIFPQDEQLWQRVIDSRFTFDEGAILSFPRETFILAMPKSFEVARGIAMPSVAVAVYPNFEDRLRKHVSLLDRSHVLERSIDTLERAAKIAKEVTPAPLVTLAFRSLGPLDRHVVSGNQHLEALLSEATDTGEAVGLDAMVLRKAARLVAGLCVYNSATNGSTLREGMPTRNGMPELKGVSPDQRYQHFQIGKPHTSAPRETTTHVRSWHFRCLKNPRYYQHEHKDREVGSRWVFVDEALVRGKATTVEGEPA